MNDRKQTVNEAVEQILTTYDYGQTIQFSYLERIFGCEKEDIEFAYLTSAVKNELIEYGCILTTVLGEGYRILYPNEIAKEVYKKHIKASVNRLAKGLRIMQGIDQSYLTTEEKNQFDSMQNLLGEMYRTSENSLLQAQFLLGEAKKKELGE